MSIKPFIEQNEYGKLDSILEFLNKDPKSSILLNQIVDGMLSLEKGYKVKYIDPQYGGSVVKAEIELALNHLHQVERYINANGNSYQINFSGRVFIKSGGYKKKICNEKWANFYQKMTSILVCLGTVAAGIYGGFEIWRYFHDLPK